MLTGNEYALEIFLTNFYKGNELFERLGFRAGVILNEGVSSKGNGYT